MNMVKKIAIAAAFFGAVTVASAQEDNSFKVGARANYSAQLIGNADAGPLGVGVGVALSIPLGPVAIAPEVAFLYRQNFSQKVDYIYYSYELSQSEFAISVPVLVRWFPTDGLYIQAGVQADIPIGASLCGKFTIAGVEAPEECVDMDGTEFKILGQPSGLSYKRASVDVGIPSGIGYMISPNLGVDVRYVVGLLSFAEETQDLGLLKVKTDFDPLHTVSAGVTYYF